MSLQPTILIVDDEKHTRDGLRRLLEDEYDTYVAEDIRGAMDVLEREPIDVMLTDLRLGGDDGMQLIERALKLPHPAICIMMTAYGSRSEEHTSELQSPCNLVCRLLLEKKKQQ